MDRPEIVIPVEDYGKGFIGVCMMDEIHDLADVVSFSLSNSYFSVLSACLAQLMKYGPEAWRQNRGGHLAPRGNLIIH